MPRRIFSAGTVTNTTGAPLRLTFYANSTTARRETDLWTVDGSNNPSAQIPNGVILTDASGAYSAFAGPDDVDTLYLNAHTGASRTAIAASGYVASSRLPNTYAQFALTGIQPAALTSSRRARKAIGAVRAGTGDMKILCVGDSTTWGAQGGTYAPASSYPQILAASLNSYFAPAYSGFATAPSSASGSGHTVTTDPRWSAGTGWALTAQGFGAASSWQAPNGTATALTYTPGINCDTFDVYYIRNTSFGTLGMAIDGGSVTTQSAAGAASIQKATVTAGSAATNHVLSLTNTGGGSVFIAAVEARLSTTKAIRVANAGVSSSRTSFWTGTGSFLGLDAIRAYAPDLTFINLGINDAVASVASSTVSTNLGLIGDAAAISGDVALTSVVPSQTSAYATLETQYRTDTQALAAAKGWHYLDVQARFGDWTSANAMGFMYDDKHPKTEGYADMAQVSANFIRNL